MNDERFERALTGVLRQIAGREAPPSLRYRVADITEEPPQRVSWFSPPLRLAFAAVAVVAVVALAILFLPRELVGPSPTSSAEPTSAASASPAVTTPTPGASATLAPTSEPTPAPTPALTTWTGIAWNDPHEPFPHQPPVYVNQEGTSTYLNTILPWDGGFVAAGGISHGLQCEEAAFFRSDVGVDWTITARFSSGDQFAFYMCPDYIVSTPDGLLAIGQQRIWRSTDGVAWKEVESPSWRALWRSGLPQLLGVASGQAGVVAIGFDTDVGQSTGMGQTIAVHSADGSTWEQVDLPADEMPIVRDVAAYPGGFVIVGRDGQPDGEASQQHPAVVPGEGRPAAWMSIDGVTWNESTVEGKRAQGATLTKVLVGSAGLFAVGINDATDYYPTVMYDTGDVATAWASTGGSSWRITGTLGGDLPPMAMLASDGTNMVGLGLRQSSAAGEPTAWASADGVHWTALTVSGPAPDVGYMTLEPHLGYNPPDTALWILPDGLLALARGDGVPVDQPYASQWFRFATATSR